MNTLQIIALFSSADKVQALVLSTVTLQFLHQALLLLILEMTGATMGG